MLSSSWPTIDAARIVRYHTIDNEHTAVLLTDICCASLIQYAFLMPIFKRGVSESIAVISSEFIKHIDEISHGSQPSESSRDKPSATAIPCPAKFLCAFTKEGHFNYGCHASWSNERFFEARALLLAARLIATNSVRAAQPH